MLALCLVVIDCQGLSSFGPPPQTPTLSSRQLRDKEVGKTRESPGLLPSWIAGIMMILLPVDFEFVATIFDS